MGRKNLTGCGMKKGWLRPIITCFLLINFLMTSIAPVMAESVSLLPAPGMMVDISPAFKPCLMQGVRFHPENSFRYDFLIDSGDADLAGDALSQESTKLIKYLMAALTTPVQDLWVNLSPYEGDRIIPDAFGLTEMGRDLLAQDYILKQITSSFLYPEKALGKKFWDRVYARSQELYGTTDIPIETFHKVWIVPAVADIVVRNNTAYVVKSRLKLMMEDDYLATEKNITAANNAAEIDPKDISTQIMREVILPELEREVNEGKNFTTVRQVYNPLILATWMKRKFADQASALSREYVDQRKTPGVEHGEEAVAEHIWQRYVEAFKTGVFNFIKEEPGLDAGETLPRKYFSGGADYAALDKTLREVGDDQVPGGSSAVVVTADLVPSNNAPKEEASVQTGLAVLDPQKMQDLNETIKRKFNERPLGWEVALGNASHMLIVPQVRSKGNVWRVLYNGEKQDVDIEALRVEGTKKFGPLTCAFVNGRVRIEAEDGNSVDIPADGQGKAFMRRENSLNNEELPTLNGVVQWDKWQYLKFFLSLDGAIPEEGKSASNIEGFWKSGKDGKLTFATSWIYMDHMASSHGNIDTSDLMGMGLLSVMAERIFDVLPVGSQIRVDAIIEEESGVMFRNVVRGYFKNNKMTDEAIEISIAGLGEEALEDFKKLLNDTVQETPFGKALGSAGFKVAGSPNNPRGYLISSIVAEKADAAAKSFDDIGAYMMMFNTMMDLFQVSQERLYKGKIVNIGLESVGYKGLMRDKQGRPLNIVTQLLREGVDIIGIDPNKEILALAKEYPGHFYQETAQNMSSIPDGTVDTVVSVGLFNPEHVDEIIEQAGGTAEEFYEQSSQEIRRILKPDGRALISTGILKPDVVFRKALENAGFNIEIKAGVYQLSRKADEGVGNIKDTKGVAFDDIDAMPEVYRRDVEKMLEATKVYLEVLASNIKKITSEEVLTPKDVVEVEQAGDQYLNKADVIWKAMLDKDADKKFAEAFVHTQTLRIMWDNKGDLGTDYDIPNLVYGARGSNLLNPGPGFLIKKQEQLNKTNAFLERLLQSGQSFGYLRNSKYEINFIHPEVSPEGPKAVVKPPEVTPGGIDMNTDRMNMNVTEDAGSVTASMHGAGVVMGEINGLQPVIIGIQPEQNVRTVLGLDALRTAL